MQGAPEAISGSGGSHLKRALFNLRICIGGISCIADGWGGGGGGLGTDLTHAHQQRDRNWMKNCHRLLATKASPMKAIKVIAPALMTIFQMMKRTVLFKTSQNRTD